MHTHTHAGILAQDCEGSTSPDNASHEATKSMKAAAAAQAMKPMKAMKAMKATNKATPRRVRTNRPGYHLGKSNRTKLTFAPGVFPPTAKEFETLGVRRMHIIGFIDAKEPKHITLSMVFKERSDGTQARLRDCPACGAARHP